MSLVFIRKDYYCEGVSIYVLSGGCGVCVGIDWANRLIWPRYRYRYCYGEAVVPIPSDLTKEEILRYAEALARMI